MHYILTILYVVAITVLVNSFAFLYPSIPFILASVFLLISVNVICGLLAIRSKKLRLKILYRGSVILISFFVSVVIAAVFHILMWLGYIEIPRNIIIYSAIYCAVCEFCVFWHGIICVYLTSVQLGIKYRIIGLACGFVPIVNLFVLGIIINKSYSEFVFEYKKEKLNAARADNKICATKYPVLLVHGVFFRDSKYLNYWGRVPKELEENGATCYFGNHQSAASVADCGEEIAARIREITAKTGCEKVNIIAHSKGGLDSRYALANLGVADMVASVTTVNTPHRGCAFAEWLLEKASPELKERVAAAYNGAATLIGDKSPDFIAAVSDLRADVCVEFDKSTGIPDGIFTQSFGSVMKKALAGRFPMNISHSFVKNFDGKNDGLVGEESFAWGSKYTLLESKGRRGISHADMIDLYRENVRGFDVREFYVGVVSELREMGL